MSLTFAVTGVGRWSTRHLAALLAGMIVLSVVGAASTRQAFAGTADRLMSVIVREMPGAGRAPERAVLDAGGSVDRQIRIINGFSATVPASRLAAVAQTPGVVAVTPNGRVRLLADAGDPTSSFATMFNVTKSIGAQKVWDQGLTGKGVDVALIDSGVAPVKGLDTADKIVYGPDLSFESQSDSLRHLDTFGHGTHMASLIAGKDSDFRPMTTTTCDLSCQAGLTSPTTKTTYANKDYFLGVAPDSRVVSIKVAAADGSTDVSQVIAAIDWAVQNRNKHGLNIRVMNLSFGTDSTQSYLLDPLAYAAEVAWHKGIVVVVAAGNAGFGSPALNNPAIDPFVIAVGATDMMDTTGTGNDIIAPFSSGGDATRRPDFSAPGKSVQGLRVPGSFLDNTFPNARVQGRLFKGSGTSQSAAIVSGAAAVLLQQRPDLTPDQVKKILTASVAPLPSADPITGGKGGVDIGRAASSSTPTAAASAQTFPRATGLGSLELARGSVHVTDQGAELRGELDIFGQAFATATWAPAAWEGSTWSGGDWNGSTWSGSTWSGSTWSGSTWSGSTWSGSTWSGSTWSGSTWSGSTWSGSTWSGGGWSSDGWLGVTWG